MDIIATAGAAPHRESTKHWSRPAYSARGGPPTVNMRRSGALCLSGTLANRSK